MFKIILCCIGILILWVVSVITIAIGVALGIEIKLTEKKDSKNEMCE